MENPIKSESLAMQTAKKCSFNGLAWSLRRLYCPVKKNALVLEVGSGGNPYFRANVLCDSYITTQERFFVPLVHDRPTIIAPAENLPFKDNAFDFVIASHVLEHSDNPAKFLEELQRVAKAGYIEVPDAVMERLTHYTFHRLEITERNGELIIRKKKNYIQDKELAELFDYKAIKLFSGLVSKHPFDFHVRFYWSKIGGGLKYKIINPEYEFDWEPPSFEEKDMGNKFNFVAFVKTGILKIIRRIFSQNARNKKIDIRNLLMCDICKGEDFDVKKGEVICKKCGKKFLFFK